MHNRTEPPADQTLPNHNPCASLFPTHPTSCSGVQDQQQRAALTLHFDPKKPKRGQVFVAFGSHCDHNPWHGWVFAADLGLNKFNWIFSTSTGGDNSPEGSRSGIWQAGAPLLLHKGKGGKPFLYFATGNGRYDPPSGDYGDSIIKLDATTGRVADVYAPPTQELDNQLDLDQGSGGITLVHIGGKDLLVQAGKEPCIYVLDAATPGTSPAQILPAPYPPNPTLNYCTKGVAADVNKPAFLSKAAYLSTTQSIFYHALNDVMRRYDFTSTGVLQGKGSRREVPKSSTGRIALLAD